jgi:Fe-S-cluster containining protein
MEVFESGGRDRFRLPCPALDGACCSIYADRFAICRSFRCALLRRYEAGEVGLEEALEFVATAKDMLERAEARFPGNRPLLARRALAANLLEQIKAPDVSSETAQAYVELIALERFLDARFRNPKKDRGEALDVGSE